MPIKFEKTTDKREIARTIANRLISKLSAGKKVLWLVPGGSNIHIAVDVMQQIPEELSQNLTVGLTDERYGKIGHDDSNWKQLDDAGFDPKQAKTLMVLDNSDSPEQNAANYEKKYREALAQNDVTIGFFGMGGDGHTSGIKPESVSAHEHSDDVLIVGYNFTDYDRITTSFAAIAKLDAAFLVAFGEDKRPAMENLKKEIPLEQQPTQILKQVPETIVFSDILHEVSNR
jgi:6-phosphogluconolactonase/glucosamine-6-phosphate isomerase/deaminase